MRPPLSRPPHQALPPGRVPHVRGLSRTWVEHDLFSMLSPPVSTYLQEKQRRASPIFFNPGTLVRTWGTRPGGKAGKEERDLSPDRPVAFLAHPL